VIVVRGAGPGDIATQVKHRWAGHVECCFVAGRGHRRRKTFFLTKPGLQTGRYEYKMRVEVLVIAFQWISLAVTSGWSARLYGVNGDDIATVMRARECS
jgi:hypothetical protein